MKPVQKYSLVSYFVHIPGCKPFFKSIAGAIVASTTTSIGFFLDLKESRKIPYQKYLNVRMTVRYLYDI